MNDGGETGFSQNDICGTTGSVGGTLDSDTDIGTRQGGGVVSTITSHGAKMTKALETFNDLILVLGENAGETIGVQDHLVQVGMLATGGGSVLQDLGGIHVVTQTKTTSSFFSDGELITGDHLDSYTEKESIINGLLGVLTGRVEDGEETDEFETVTLSLVVVTLDFLGSDSEGTETTGGKFLDVILESVLDLVGLVAGAKLDDDAGHTLRDALKTAGRLLTVSTLGALVNGVEGFEVKDLDALVSLGGVGDGTNDTRVDGVLVLGTRSVGSQLDDIVSREGAVSPDGGAIDGEFVSGEGTGLVGTENGNSGQLLDGGDTGDDGLVLGELLSTDGEGDGQDGGHGDRNTTDQEDKDVIETITVRVVISGVEDENLEEDEETDGDETE